MNNSNVISYLLNEISKLIDKKIDTKQSDKTFKSAIWKINENNTFSVNYKGQLYDVPNASGISLSLGQVVWVKMPDGILRNMYIESVPNAIMSSSNGGGSTSDGHTHSNKSILDSITSNLCSAWNSAVTHSTSTHAPTNAERNVVIGVQKNGSDLTVDSSTRKVNIIVPTKTSELTNDSGFKTTDTTYSQATSSALGLVKIGYTESGKNYPVELNGSGQMYVNVPWTDNNTVYTHPTSSGNKHIPSGGSSGQILRWSADGTATWGADNKGTTITVATSEPTNQSVGDHWLLEY